ncbi:Inner membrane protein yfdC [Serratia odorifera]|uniref:Inner membrane protein yfdC n=1 Tax=Serratia odorifera TaxID=618 RepID=A0A3S4DKU9_SEROD|nr:Inner membrane protein yfdC [Serratia odorifera]
MSDKPNLGLDDEKRGDKGEVKVESKEQEQGKAEIEVDEEKLPSRAAAVHEQIRMEGEKELERDWLALLWSAVAAGLSMGASLMAKGIFHARLPDDPSRFFIENIGYTFGFVIVIMARQQLFTENTVTAVLPIMHKPTPKNFLILFRLWSVVLLGNLIGTGLAAEAFIQLPLFDDATRQAFTDLAKEVMQNSPEEMFANGILAGWIIATMVWMFPSSGAAKIWGDRADDLSGRHRRSDAHCGGLGGDTVSGVQRRSPLAGFFLSVRDPDAGGQHHRRIVYLCADQPRADP